jgi:hypothetical protein
MNRIISAHGGMDALVRPVEHLRDMGRSGDVGQYGLTLHAWNERAQPCI